MQVRCLIGLTAFATVMGTSVFSTVMAQTVKPLPQIAQADIAPATRPAPVRNNFEGRGVAQGSTFTRGRNATAVLTIDRNNYTFELTERGTGRARVRYEGIVNRQSSGGANSFTLDGRVQRFSSSEKLRLINVSTGNCRIEVFDARVVSSNCRSVVPNSTTQFLGVEQF
jgi:hypothetical protein